PPVTSATFPVRSNLLKLTRTPSGSMRRYSVLRAGHAAPLYRLSRGHTVNAVQHALAAHGAHHGLGHALAQGCRRTRAGRRDMAGHNDLIHAQQRAVGLDWLGVGHIQPRATDLAAA